MYDDLPIIVFTLVFTLWVGLIAYFAFHLFIKENHHEN